MSKADRRQLEQLLGPLARTWLAHKLEVVRHLFEEQISGDIFTSARQARERAAALVLIIDQALTDLEK